LGDAGKVLDVSRERAARGLYDSGGISQRERPSSFCVDIVDGYGSLTDLSEALGASAG
jgi:hypothetical protein